MLAAAFVVAAVLLAVVSVDGAPVSLFRAAVATGSHSRRLQEAGCESSRRTFGDAQLSCLPIELNVAAFGEPVISVEESLVGSPSTSSDRLRGKPASSAQTNVLKLKKAMAEDEIVYESVNASAVLAVLVKTGLGVTGNVPLVSSEGGDFLHIAPCGVDCHVATRVSIRILSEQDVSSPNGDTAIPDGDIPIVTGQDGQNDSAVIPDNGGDPTATLAPSLRSGSDATNADPMCSLGVLSVDSAFCCSRATCTQCSSSPTCSGPCCGTQIVASRSCGSVGAPCQMIVTQSVSVAYTSTVVANTADLDGLIKLAIAETNAAYEASRVPIRMVLGQSFLVSIPDSPDSYTMLMSFRGADRRGANVAVLLSSRLTSCGRGFLDCTRYSTDNCAYAVVKVSCATGYYSFGHEIGHIQGLDHNQEFSSDPYARFSDNHGWVLKQGYPEDGAYRTVMAYSVIDEKRIPMFSNPDVSIDNLPAGQSGVANNARVLRFTRFAVSKLNTPGYFPTNPPTDSTATTATSAPVITRTPTTIRPTNEPTTRSPTTARPTGEPTTRAPTTGRPTIEPTSRAPTLIPTARPTLSPTAFPTLTPTDAITAQPTALPTAATLQPTGLPTRATLQPTGPPTPRPTLLPTSQPTGQPTPRPTLIPTPPPTNDPTPGPTNQLPNTQTPTRPTRTPTLNPTEATEQPTGRPSTPIPTRLTKSPTTRSDPTDSPSQAIREPDPTAVPSSRSPTPRPTWWTRSPSEPPSASPTFDPADITRSPTRPTRNPTSSRPSLSPVSKSPTNDPTSRPTLPPTQPPTRRPSEAPTTSRPSREPTARPTRLPTAQPTTRPSLGPTTARPSSEPTAKPTRLPTAQPTRRPSSSPVTSGPTQSPSTSSPSMHPTIAPTGLPTLDPTPAPTSQTPTRSPTEPTTSEPSTSPSLTPSLAPVDPTESPIFRWTRFPTVPAPTRSEIRSGFTLAPTPADQPVDTASPTDGGDGGGRGGGGSGGFAATSQNTMIATIVAAGVPLLLAVILLIGGLLVVRHQRQQRSANTDANYAERRRRETQLTQFNSAANPMFGEDVDIDEENPLAQSPVIMSTAAASPQKRAATKVTRRHKEKPLGSSTSGSTRKSFAVPQPPPSRPPRPPSHDADGRFKGRLVAYIDEDGDQDMDDMFAPPAHPPAPPPSPPPPPPPDDGEEEEKQDYEVRADLQ